MNILYYHKVLHFKLSQWLFSALQLLFDFQAKTTSIPSLFKTLIFVQKSSFTKKLNYNSMRPKLKGKELAQKFKYF